MKKQFQQLLHHYKVEAFKLSHSHESVQEATRELMEFSSQALNNEYHYHFENDPDPKRIETLNLIKNYTLEALLPPVVEKLVWRITVLEKQHAELVKMFGDLLETLSDDDLRFDGEDK